MVNDFGSINIDSMMVAGQVDSMVSLGNGCLCCAADTEDLDVMFESLAGGSSPLDVIVVEASGLAEPRNMIRMVLASENRNIVYGGLVCVVDSVEFTHTRARHSSIDQHLQMADLLILNKTDRLTAVEVDAVRAHVRAVVPDVPLLTTDHGRVDAQLLFDVPDRVEDLATARQLSFDELMYEDDDHSTHLHAGYTTTTFETHEPLDPRRFIEVLENPTGEVYRVKGFVRFDVAGYPGTYVVDTVGRHIRLAPVGPEKSGVGAGRAAGTQIVFIGTDLDDELVEVRLLDCVRRRGDPTDEAAILPVHRYVAQDSR